jgi:stage V sporulation protein R
MDLKLDVIWKFMARRELRRFIDRVLSLENLLDMNHLFETNEVIRSREEKLRLAKREEENGGYVVDDRSAPLKSFMRKQAKLKETKEDINLNEEEIIINPENNEAKGEKDILRFLIEYAPIEEWEADIIGCLREEAYYFLPQRITKIMNEGWASYWHSTIMNNRAMNSNEFIDFADKHAGVMAMSRQNINPYKIGIELMRDIEYRWDTGRFGKDYNECESLHDKENWDLKLNQGREKIFEVRKSHNDISFIDEYLTPEFCNRMQIFTYKYNPRSGRMEIDTRDFDAIKQKLLTQLTNFGSPLIQVEDSNYMNRKELLLKHIHYGVDLDMEFATETMRNIYYIWKRPVNLATIYEEKEVIFHFDGKQLKHLNK